MAALLHPQIWHMGQQEPWRKLDSWFINLGWGASLVVSLVAQLIKNPPAMRETSVWSLGWEDSPGEGKGYSSILAWRIPGTVERESDTTEQLSLSLFTFTMSCARKSLRALSLYFYPLTLHPRMNLSPYKITFLSWLSSSVQFNSVVSDSLQPHGLQHARPPCPSPTPGVYSNSCPLSWWYHPTISSSVVPFSSRLQSFPASWSFQMSQVAIWNGHLRWPFGASGGQVLQLQLQHQSFQWIFRTDFL